MEDSRKKPIMIAVIVICFGAAAAITFRGRGGGSEVPSDATVWLKCANRECGDTREMNAREYHKYMRENMSGDLEGDPAMTCEKCGKQSVFEAVKCINESCGYIFFKNEAGPRDYADRCPKCKVSAFEESRKPTGG